MRDIESDVFINRELSLVAFQRRVLEEALDVANPLLERVRFLAIVASNLDELFMVRFADLLRQLDGGVQAMSPDGLSPSEQVAALRREAAELSVEVSEYWQEQLLPALARAGIEVLDHAKLDEHQRAAAWAYFDDIVFPALTPLAVEPRVASRPVRSLALSVAIFMEARDGSERLVHVEVPHTLPRLVPIPPSGRVRTDAGGAERHAFVWLEELIGAHAQRFALAHRVVDVHAFRATRDAEVPMDEEDTTDVLEAMTVGVRRRRVGRVVRLEVSAAADARRRTALLEHVGVAPANVFACSHSLGMAALRAVADLPRPDLRFPPIRPVIPGAFVHRRRPEDTFAAIRRRDVLLHHPFDSFEPVVAFLNAAARDPDVIAVKHTLYRADRGSPVLHALLGAARRGKQVTAVIELKARFDEENNIAWARKLEAEGVHVVHGLVGYKVHCKLTLVVRREAGGLARYVHLSTGNYNAVTSTIYTDVGYFTCDPEIGEDATHLFNLLTTGCRGANYRSLLVAPIDLRERFIALIDRERAHAEGGRGGHLVFKMNALVDVEIMRALIRAARSGVRVDLLVRGVCCLRPQVPGATDGITVTSVVGRFLEHSRIYWVANAGKPEVYLGSADLMPRNLDRRVELLFPVRDAHLAHRLRHTVLETYLRDDERARRLRADGTYGRLVPRAGATPVDSQAALLAAAQLGAVSGPRPVPTAALEPGGEEAFPRVA